MLRLSNCNSGGILPSTKPLLNQCLGRSIDSCVLSRAKPSEALSQSGCITKLTREGLRWGKMPERYDAVLTISLRNVLSDCGGSEPSLADENRMSVRCRHALLEIENGAAAQAYSMGVLTATSIFHLREWTKCMTRDKARQIFSEAITIGLDYCPSHPVFVAYVDALQQEVTRLSLRLWKWMHEGLRRTSSRRIRHPSTRRLFAESSFALVFARTCTFVQLLLFTEAGAN
jgi:hypothetical protein